MTTYRSAGVDITRAEDAIARIDVPSPPSADGDPCAGVWTSFGE